MRKLVLGVIDTPYQDENMTTGKVAGFLESKYHVMEHFYEAQKTDIAKALGESVKGAIETILMGGPVTDPYIGATEKMRIEFSRFLSEKKMDSMGYPGIPTKASLEGKSKRFKKGKSKRGPRPSFIDTGLYESSFYAEVI